MSDGIFRLDKIYILTIPRGGYPMEIRRTGVSHKFLRTWSTLELPSPVPAFATYPLFEVTALGDSRFYDEFYIDESKRLVP